MNPYAIIGAIAMAIALAGGGYYQGWEMRGDHEAAIALKLERKVAADKLEAARVAAATLAAEVKRADELEAKLAIEKGTIHEVVVEVIKEVPKVTTVYVEVPGEKPKAIPPAVIVWGAVSLYNRALRPDLPASSSEFAHPPGATDLTRAPVDTPDILNVHAINAGKYAECRASLNKLIDFELGKAKPAPAQGMSGQ